MYNGTENEFLVLHWKIENFSYWNWEIHGKVIMSAKSQTRPNFWMELFPRGLSGNGDHLVVHLCCEGNWVYYGELSYIGSDGSLLKEQHVEGETKEVKGVLELPLGPEFKVVVAQIRENEALQKDRLTLRLRLKSPFIFTHYMCTKIDVLDASLKISPKLLNKVYTFATLITSFKKLFDEDEVSFLKLVAWKDRIDYSKITLAFVPNNFSKNISVLTNMTVFNNEGEVQRTEKKEHLFRDGTKWSFFDSLTKEEVIEKRFSLALHIKIIPSKKYIDSFIYIQYHPQDVHLNTTGSGVTNDTSKTPENSATVLAKELMCLYQDQDFSDFQLKSGDVTFPVHKNILSARSPVFKTMLSTDMRESVSGCMDIVDLDPSTLSRFLAFLYTGAVARGERPEALLRGRQVPGTLPQEGMCQFPVCQRVHFECVPHFVSCKQTPRRPTDRCGSRVHLEELQTSLEFRRVEEFHEK